MRQTRVLGYECPTATIFKTIVRGRSEDHVVEMAPWVQGPHVFNWRCSCAQFRPNHWCRHIAVAKRSWCGWIQSIHGGHPRNGHCPRCGRKVKLSERTVRLPL